MDMDSKTNSASLRLAREKAILDDAEKLSAKRPLANNLIHEIKTPVSIIISYIETMIEHDVDDATRKKFLIKCLENAERLQKITDNLSRITRLDDVQSHELKLVNFSEIAASVFSNMSVMLQGKNISGVCNLPNDITMMGDKGLIINVLENLVKNAFHYSQGTQVRLDLLSHDDKSFTVTFSDNGEGVPPECIPHLFERFYRVDKERNPSGTGLGLSIVKSSVERLGGRIIAENAAPHGLLFTITFPKPTPKQ